MKCMISNSNSIYRYSYATAGAIMTVGTKVGVKVGLAAAAYDLQRKNVLFGGCFSRISVNY